MQKNMIILLYKYNIYNIIFKSQSNYLKIANYYDKIK